MRFELTGKTKAKLLLVKPQSKKLGQKELQAEVKLRVRAMVTNTALEMICPGMRQSFYERSNRAANEQKTLDGVPVVTDMPQMTQLGTLFPALRPEKLEQTGSRVTLDYGRGGDANIVLGGSTLKNFKILLQDGGMTPIEFDVLSTDVDHDTFGSLAMLVNHDTEIEVLAPEIVQDEIDDPEDKNEDQPRPKPGPQTPEAALAEANGVPA